MTHVSRAALSAVLAFLAAGNLSCGTPLVGGDCADGYVLYYGTCVPKPADCPVLPAPVTCPDGLVLCSGVCTELAKDTNNCGVCGVLCPVGECIDGLCTTGATAGGHVVLMGMNLEEATPSSLDARLLGNAVFLSRHDPVRILDYREFALWNGSSVANVVSLVADEALSRHRTIAFHVAPTADAVPALLASGDYDVFLIHDQAAAAPSSLASVGAAWAQPVADYAAQGGIAVVLVSATGSNQMGDLVSGLQILHGAVTIQSVTDGLRVNAPADFLAFGMVEPFTPAASVASFASSDAASPSLVSVVVTGSGAPVVIDRILPAN